MNDHDEAIKIARSWLEQSPLFLDTETTGLDGSAEIVDIALIDNEGETILNTLVKPTCPIPPEATAKHHITDEMVKDAPTFAELWPFLRAILRNRLIVAYNAEHDLRLIKQSMKVAGYYGPAIEELDQEARFDCAMILYAQFYGDWNDYHGNYRWQRLSFAAKQAGYPEWEEHRAVRDTRALLHVVKHMAECQTSEEAQP